MPPDWSRSRPRRRLRAVRAVPRTCAGVCPLLYHPTRDTLVLFLSSFDVLDVAFQPGSGLLVSFLSGLLSKHDRGTTGFASKSERVALGVHPPVRAARGEVQEVTSLTPSPHGTAKRRGLAAERSPRRRDRFGPLWTLFASTRVLPRAGLHFSV